MGRFRAKGITVRELETIEIVFKDRETIWVIPKGASSNIIFHRWWSPRGSYSNGWQDLRRGLWRNRHLDLAHCLLLASRYGVAFTTTFRKPKLDESQIIKRKEKG